MDHLAIPQEFVLRDVGDQPYSIHSITLKTSTPDAYALTSNCPTGTFGPASLCTLTLRFKPHETGPHNATLSVQDTAPGSPHEVSITGQGAQVVLSPGSLTFPNTAVGATSNLQTITLTNVAPTRYLLVNVSVPDGFNWEDGEYLVSPNQTVQYTFSFSPTKKGQQSGQISFSFTSEDGYHGNNLTTTQNITVSGTGK